MSPPPRPHALARAPMVERADAFFRTAWDRGWIDRVGVDPVALWAQAAEKEDISGEGAGRSDADIRDFRERLDALCNSLQNEARLNSLGIAFAYGQLMRALRQRLALGNLWRDRPEILEQELAPPIIVVGQMRSGTTRVHRLLAADPAIAATRFCDSWNPVPRTPDTRPAWSALSLVCARMLDPWIDSIHPFGVTRPDEELGWLASALDHCAYEAQWHIPSFTRFSEERDPAPVYREFSRILRTDADFHGNAGLPRVLKVPQFAEDLPALLRQFPDARVVLTRRCDDDTAASAASLVANQMTIQSDDVDMAWIEAEVVRKIKLREKRIESALSDFHGPLSIVQFEELNEDWRSAIRRTYAELGFDLSPEAMVAMSKEQKRAERSPHGNHAEQMREFAASEAA